MKTLIYILIIWLSYKPINNLLKPSDYRDAYCGNYSGKRIHKYLSSGTIHLDTINYTIAISKNGSDSLINIETTENVFVGKLTNHKVIGNKYYSFFSNDSIYLTYIPSLGPNYYKYIGKK